MPKRRKGKPRHYPRPAAHRSTALAATARRAAASGEWGAVRSCAREILALDRESAEGWFLAGLADRSSGNLPNAAKAFRRVLQLNAERYDAGIELARICQGQMRLQECKDLLERFEPQLANSPLYLEMAAETWTRLGLHARAAPLLEKALELQPEIERFQAARAANAVLLGRIEEAKALYRGLLEKHPQHQRNHYELSRLERARDRSHVEQMRSVLEATRFPPQRNIFLYYAIGKELEDLGEWGEAFEYYKRGGDAAADGARSAGYRVESDVALIERIMEVCNGEWLTASPSGMSGERMDGVAGPGRPLFVVGLPRTGTTLTERIIASHSQVESADETFFLQTAIHRVSGVQSHQDMTPQVIAAAAREDPGRIAETYLDLVAYRLEGQKFFVEKYPLNYLYLGFIARAFPKSPIVHLRRHPMDACFAMYKQSFFRFAYTLEDLADYYVAYDRLNRHWQRHLADRIVEVQYESLAAEPEAQTRRLLDRLELPFEQACVDFHLNEAPSATASAAQIREKAHTRSVGRWRRFERQLQPLRKRLEAAGIATD